MKEPNKPKPSEYEPMVAKATRAINSADWEKILKEAKEEELAEKRKLEEERIDPNGEFMRQYLADMRD